ncbi:MAG: type 4a pilus biogenesis protein PilO [Patescibacteria group bacterium]
MNKDKLANLSKKYGPTMLCVVILFLVLSNIVLPLINNIKQLSTDVFKERHKLEELYLKGQSLKRSTEEYRKIKNDISELENIFISENNELRLITDMETLAQKNNVTQEINIKENNKDSDTEKMFIELNIAGQYSNIINYIQAVEKLDIYVNFNNLRFSSHSSTSRNRNSQILPEIFNAENPNINLYLSGVAYYWRK